MFGCYCEPMSVVPEPETEPKSDSTKCLTRSVVDVLSKEPTLEAVTFNRTRQVISVATLGQTDVPRLTQQLAERLQRAQAGGTDTAHCRLLQGESDCSTCDTPLSPEEWHKVTVRHDGDATTIARVTCPTAPKFWRWREIPFPKVVQRDVEFLEHAEEIDEWKAQLVAAILCGVFGLAGYFFHEQPYRIVGYLLAYLAGAWFTVHEVWERLQKRAVDVHFLMLSVAAGSGQQSAPGRKARRCCFCFHFPARWNISRWAARKKKSVRFSAKRPKWPRCWTRKATNAK